MVKHRESIIFILLRELRKCRMGPAHKAVLLSLADRSNHVRIAWPSMDTLQADCGMGRSQLRRVLDDLEAHRWIRVIFKGTGRFTTRYLVHENGKDIPVCMEALAAFGRNEQKQAARESMSEVPDDCEEDSTATPMGLNEDGTPRREPSFEAAECGSKKLSSETPLGGDTGTRGGRYRTPRPRNEDPNTLQDTPQKTPPDPQDKNRACVRESRTTENNHRPVSSTADNGPTTSRSPSTKETPSQKPVEQPSKPAFAEPTAYVIGPPATPSNNLCTAHDLLSWLAVHPCLAKLIPDEKTAKRWASDVTGIFIATGTRSCDVYEAVLTFVAKHSDDARDWDRSHIASAIGVFLRNAKMYGDSARARKAAREKDMANCREQAKQKQLHPALTVARNLAAKKESGEW